VREAPSDDGGGHLVSILFSVGAFTRRCLLASTITAIDVETPSRKLKPQQRDLLPIDLVACVAKYVEACGAEADLPVSEPHTTARANDRFGHDAPAQPIVAPPLRGPNTRTKRQVK